jgi:hypothetical protein
MTQIAQRGHPQITQITQMVRTRNAEPETKNQERGEKYPQISQITQIVLSRIEQRAGRKTAVYANGSGMNSAGRGTGNWRPTRVEETRVET